MKIVTYVWLPCLTAALIACGSSSSGDGSTSSANPTPVTATSTGAGGASASSSSASSASATTGTGGMGGCTPIANVATTIDDIQNAAMLPTPMGGTIADGTYTMTSHITYAGAPFTVKK